MIPITRPSIGREEEDATLRVIRSGWITQGPEVARFEHEFAAAVGARHACAVSSCTTALHLALLACGVGEGDLVAAPSHTFIATANAIRYCGALPLFIDIQPGTYNIDPELLRASISPKVRAIVCVHQMGMPCDLASILEVARERGIPVIEDAACAAGSELLFGGEWQRIGRPHADIGCFSFHPRKVITTGDGGMLTTPDEGADARFRTLRQHGMSIPDTVRHRSPQVLFEHYSHAGFNYRMTDLQAALGRVQLSRLPGLVAQRRALVGRYKELLSDIPTLQLPAEPAWARSNWQSYCVRLPSGVDQKQVMQRLLDDQIASRRGIMCCHLEPAYQSIPWLAGAGGLHHSEAAQRECILLPLFPGMSEAEQDRVAASLRGALGCGDWK